ncbi:MAG TPA: glycosyltransferase 87 family protein [Acidimicrobiales bacterium]|nr:glycosyltransferase 87 family protein [Acidimicrobiales bacterium]
MLLVLAGGACFVGIVVARQGPPAGGDTAPLTAVTSALADGHLHAAAADDGLPNPPGYALLVAPLVAAFPTWVGAPAWCTQPGRADGLRAQTQYAHDPAFGTDVGECGSPRRLADGDLAPSLPPWYRAQGVLGIVGWIVLAAGGLVLLRAGGADTPARMAALVVLLAFLPAASSAVVQLFHPQDMLSLGLALLALAQVLRQRFVAAGLLFGAALLTKQYAVLLLLPALAVAPDGRTRLRLAGAALVLFVAGLAPFFASAPRATIENLSGFSAGGAVSGATVLSLAGWSTTVVSAVARDVPVVFALGVCLWAYARRGAWLQRPEALLALGLACVGSRLVFESVIFPYYLLATSVVFFLLDLVAQRSPHRSLAWSAGAAFFVAVHPGNQAVNAVGTLAFAFLAVAAGLIEANRLSSADKDVARDAAARVQPTVA